MSQRVPRYETLSLDLAHQIAAGRLPVGATLPPERQMAHDLGVSRSTVREALRRLEMRGLISRRQGAGTVVLRTAGSTYTMQLHSLETFSLYDLDETRLEILGLSAAEPEDVARLGLAQDGLAQDGEWFRCEMLRRHIATGRPAAYTHAFLRAEFRPIFDDPQIGAEPFYRIIRRMFGTDVRDATVEFFAATAPAGARRYFAPDLPATEVVPAIRLIRSFFEAGGRLCQRSETWHCGPSGAFRTEIRLPD
ncbi:GntR family transcriptional regulator [Paenirhodobacter enshiensis]|uniref:GntR family transcriptional regulator n=1 Tax=Paenirhodobacter enshiensis TaxID=1105367 RepID=UPI003FA31FD3